MDRRRFLSCETAAANSGWIGAPRADLSLVVAKAMADARTTLASQQYEAARMLALPSRAPVGTHDVPLDREVVAQEVMWCEVAPYSFEA